MIDALTFEQATVVFLHFVIWVLLLGDIWNMTGLPPAALSDIREQFASAPSIAVPKALRVSSRWFSILGTCLHTLAPCALVVIYFFAHRSLYIACVFLMSWFLTARIIVGVSRVRFESDVRFCSSILSTLPRQ